MSKYIMKTDAEATNRVDIYGKYHAAYLNNFLSNINLKKNSKVIDFGCGPGNTTRNIADFLDKNATILGIDNSAEQIITANSRLTKNYSNVSHSVMDINNIETKYHSFFDLAYARFLLWSITDTNHAITSILSTLKTGGIIALTEIIDIESMICYPRSIAFEKYKKYMTKTMKSLKINYRTGEKLFFLLNKHNVQITYTNIIQPILDNRFKRMNIINTFDQFPFIKGCFENDLKRKKLREDLVNLIADEKRLITCFRCIEISGIKK